MVHYCIQIPMTDLSVGTLFSVPCRRFYTGVNPVEILSTFETLKMNIFFYLVQKAVTMKLF